MDQPALYHEMKSCRIILSFLLITVFFLTCDGEQDEPVFSGVYCLNLQNLEMTIFQNGDEVTFTLQTDLLTDGTGNISGDTLLLTANTSGEEIFTSRLLFTEDRTCFTGPYQVKDLNGSLKLEGILQGNKGGCATWDIVTRGIPKFITEDFTQLSKIEMISRFRSGFGHSFTDDFESCRSMKHYYNPYPEYRENRNVEAYSPVAGTIISVMNDGPAGNTGLSNKEVQIRPDGQPAFIIVLYHIDLASSDITTGLRVQAGDLLGHGRLYYEELQKYVTSFDIAVWVNTPTGLRLISYFETMSDPVFANYLARGTTAREDFIITREERDADPLECNGESFISEGTIENWVILE